MYRLSGHRERDKRRAERRKFIRALRQAQARPVNVVDQLDDNYSGVMASHFSNKDY